MKRCHQCGMAEDANEAHLKSYHGVGKHEFAIEDKDEAPDDLVVSYGGSLKSLGDGKFEGYLVRYSSADDTDLVGDYFTKSTEFFIEDGATIPILYDHGLNSTLKRTKIGRAKVAFDDVGLFIKGELDLRNKFVKAVDEHLVKKKRAGLSSGAATHMMERKAISQGVNEILSWGIAEGSVTVAPTEPRNEAYSLKSYLEIRQEDPFEPDEDTTKSIKEEAIDGATKYCLYSKMGDKLGTFDSKAEALQAQAKMGKRTMKSDLDEDELDLDDYEELDNARPMKGIYEAELASQVPSTWQLMDALREVCGDIASAAKTTDISGGVVDIRAKVTEAVTEYAARLIAAIAPQIEDFVQAEDMPGEKRSFYLKTYLADSLESFLSAEGGLVSGLGFDEHSAKVVSAAGEYANLSASFAKSLTAYSERCNKRVKFRASDTTKSRGIPAETQEKIEAIQEEMEPTLKAFESSLTLLREALAIANPDKTLPQDKVLSLQLEITKRETEMAGAI